jgi:uncharacterized protein
VATRHANPFTFGDLALDDAFTDRGPELAELRSDMLNGQNVAIIAPRRYGKSSLLRRAAQGIVHEGLLVAGGDRMKTPTKEKLASKLARAIHDDIASPLFNARERLRVFSTLRISPTITVDAGTGETTFTFAASSRSEDIDATLERLLELPAQLAAERERKVVLIFDEFQEVTDIDPRLPALMRAVFQEQPEVAHVYAGSKRDMMQRLFTHENEPFYRSAKVMELQLIPPAEFAGYLRRQFARTDRGVDDEIVDALLEVTHGHPYGTQELAYALWEALPEGFSATTDDLAAALDAVLRSENAHFTFMWEKASRTQRLLLQALAVEPGRVFSTEYRRRFDLPAASSLQRAVDALAADELVARRADGSYAIAEPFLREWMLAYGS